MSLIYNLTNVTMATTIEDKVCYLNLLTNTSIAIGILVFIIIGSLMALLYFENTIYTSSVVSLFGGAISGTILFFWRCNNIPMINKDLVILIWILFAISVFIRGIVEEK